MNNESGEYILWAIYNGVAGNVLVKGGRDVILSLDVVGSVDTGSVDTGSAEVGG